MTTPNQPGQGVSLAEAISVMLQDGWHDLDPGTTLGAVVEPLFTDPLTGLQTAPGDAWFQFVSGGVAYACPMRSIWAVKLTAPVVP